jgi:transposase InsO family protein
MNGSHTSFRNVRGGMRKSFNFYLDFSFWSAHMITSDRGPQFTSSLWLQLCEMLNISHKQTTAYNPELNGAVERLHRRLLGLRVQLREDTGLSPAEAVFGA